MFVLKYIYVKDKVKKLYDFANIKGGIRRDYLKASKSYFYDLASKIVSMQSLSSEISLQKKRLVNFIRVFRWSNIYLIYLRII